MKQRTVFIIIPVYNVEAFLERCLMSVFSQTYKNIMVICINDGSTDNSYKILLKFSDKYKNMIIINKENEGLSSARNAGLDSISCMNNSYICFIDSDDFVSPLYVEKYVNMIEKTGCSIVAGSYISFTNEEEIFSKKIKEETYSVISRNDALEKLMSGIIMCHAHCKMYKSDLFINNRFPKNMIFMEDEYLTPLLFNECESICFSNCKDYYYQFRDGSLCQSKMSPQKIIDALTSYKINVIREFNVNKEDLKKIHKLALNQFSAIYLMMYPRIELDKFTKDQVKTLNEINEYVKKTHAIFKYAPKNKKEFAKKVLFLFARNLFLKIYKKHLKNYDY